MLVPSVSEFALEILLGFLELEQLQHVLATTLVALKDMLRRFPQIAQDVIPRLAHSLDVIDESNAVTAIIAMIGEYGEIISDGPYILEEVINSWDYEDEKIRNQLLVSTLKLFFKRPKEVKPILGKLFKVATEDSLHPDVHDRALFFYRLLSDNNGANIARCKKIFSQGNTYSEFVEELDGSEVDALFEEFDTLAVIYGEGSERFRRKQHFARRRRSACRRIKKERRGGGRILQKTGRATAGTIQWRDRRDPFEFWIVSCPSCRQSPGCNSACD